MMDDQTSWVEKQHQLLNLTQEQKDVEANIKHRNQDVIVLTGKKMKLDGKSGDNASDNAAIAAANMDLYCLFGFSFVVSLGWGYI